MSTKVQQYLDQYALSFSLNDREVAVKGAPAIAIMGVIGLGIGKGIKALASRG